VAVSTRPSTFWSDSSHPELFASRFIRTSSSLTNGEAFFQERPRLFRFYGSRKELGREACKSLDHGWHSLSTSERHSRYSAFVVASETHS
jgi:hypothetical protein